MLTDYFNSLLPAIVFGALGLLVEVCFTAAHNVWNRKPPFGVVSLWMYPVYSGSFHLLSFIGDLLRGLPLYQIYFVITILIYVCEYTWGVIYRVFGITPWYYNHEIRLFGRVYALHVQHVITAVYFPFWYGFAAVIWWYFSLF